MQLIPSYVQLTFARHGSNPSLGAGVQLVSHTTQHDSILEEVLDFTVEPAANHLTEPGTHGRSGQNSLPASFAAVHTFGWARKRRNLLGIKSGTDLLVMGGMLPAVSSPPKSQGQSSPCFSGSMTNARLIWPWCAARSCGGFSSHSSAP